MTASDKIEEAKKYFQKISKSGKNNFQNFQYSELYDITPIVRKICEQYKLKTKIVPNIEMNCFELTITDREDNSYEKFYVPYALLGAGDAGRFMQDYGRCQTYAMRYLYIQAFEIAVPDEIDDKDQRKQNKQNPKQKLKPQQKPKQMQKPVKEEPEPEPTEEDIKEALDTVYDIIVSQGNKEFTLERALFQLGRKYKNRPLLVKACEESLKTNSADKVKQ